MKNDKNIWELTPNLVITNFVIDSLSKRHSQEIHLSSVYSLYIEMYLLKNETIIKKPRNC